MNLIEIKDKQQMDELVASGEIDTFSKAIKAKCYECSAYQISEVRNCHITNCPLHQFRDGHSPFRQKREMTDEQRQAASERLNRIRLTKQNNQTDKE